jgi:hypothetical protein
MYPLTSAFLQARRRYQQTGHPIVLLACGVLPCAGWSETLNRVERVLNGTSFLNWNPYSLVSDLSESRSDPNTKEDFFGS